MRNARAIALLTFVFIIGIAGVGVLLAYSLEAKAVDPCYGYAIC